MSKNRLTRVIVRSVLTQLEINAESDLHGFVIKRHVTLPPNLDHVEHWRLQHGGGIAGNSGLWWLVEIAGGKPPTGPSVRTKRDLRKLLIDWMGLRDKAS